MDAGFASLIDRAGCELRLRSTKYDRSLHFEWTCEIVSASDGALVLHQAAGTPIKTRKGVWTPEVNGRMYFWRDKWYNVIETRSPDESLRGYYCNVITPARIVEDELQWIDLDLDVSVQPNGDYRILDEDEWARNSSLLAYLPELVVCARRAMDELIGAITRRALPFDAITAEA